LLLISNFGEQYEIPLEVSVCSTINVSEQAAGSLSAFPNPADNEVRIQLAKPVESIQFFDVSGKLALSLATNGQLSIQADVRSLADGAYTLKAGNESMRLVIAR
jgi:hypothetical protein